ncbi:MAG: serine/threonine protein kinase [Myxococcaceae bacterium]|nr:serine/threonine protein kinase [Myxococcaceae bacterium]
MNLGIGQLISGRYAPVQPIGNGAFGAVYAAIDQSTGREVALKFLTNMAQTERFRREARMLQDYAHPNVVEVLDARLDHVPPFIAMEFCQFGSLRSWVQNRRPWREVAMAISQAAAGLTALHAQGGFHRDIKPDNILVARHPSQAGAVIKVGDFGVAREPETAGLMTRTAWGTDGYRAPELLKGASFTHACDVYSLGVVAVELLTGQRTTLTLGGHSLPGGFVALVGAMCAVQPEARPAMRQVAEQASAVSANPEASVVVPSSTDDGTGLLLGGLLAVGLIWALSKK